MIQWIRRHADPDECLVILLAILCVWAGWSTWNDLGGRPKDAPHLRIPGEARAFMWWGCAALGLLALRMRRGCWVRRWAHSFMGMGFMVSLRLVSYTTSWVLSWEWVDRFIPDKLVEGDPHAWGSIWLYLWAEVGLIALMFAPYDWSYLNQQTHRPGRLERPRSKNGGVH